MEGSLFVVSRSEEPKYQFVVLNRISSENLVESVSSDFQMELTDQFLLYRNDQQEISGIWFYSPSERASIAALLQSIVGGAQPTAAAAPPPTEPTAVTDDSAPANNVTQVGVGGWVGGWEGDMTVSVITAIYRRIDDLTIINYRNRFKLLIFPQPSFPYHNAITM